MVKSAICIYFRGGKVQASADVFYRKVLLLTPLHIETSPL